MSLPVIDIAPLYNDNKAHLLRVAHAIDDACRTWGFFYITGHNIPKDRVEQLTGMAKKFFALPQEEKLRINIEKTSGYHGYSTFGAEQLDSSKPSDWKEAFDMGFHMPLDHPSVVAGKPLRGPNHHPTWIEGWTELMEQHYSDMQRLALLLMRALALALDIDEDFFVSKFHEPLSVFRMIHYPELPDEKGRVVCGAHTDYGIVTLLYQDSVGGLQVQNLQGEWMDAPSLEGSYVVNIGDMMEMWSNGRYKSTPHRVLNQGVERISMPFFCQPNPETMVSCLPNCFDEANPPKFSDVTAGDWLLKRLQQLCVYSADGLKSQ
ncbi:oxidase-like protein [Leishmania mexicana MHOM/GT/2001/U1103]|uniref:Oxidase-like protein n=1 Tax=Leishmania mexicana (strain MHOM/GT/2001/U1103) TaxID=929439 RepID=E9AM54_LEIMU|nr:oxidase-like protein [Leishmania mexicana MHOM/GT/2001/U1103]CBZ24009.1 oxidase-like protein [Leishmania mexicana MHOM/GT/2001/U1103]